MKRSPTNWGTAGTAAIFLLPAMLIFTLFQFYPMCWAMLLSFYKYSALGDQSEFVGLANFGRLWGDADFWLALKNSFLYLTVVPAIIFLALLLAVLVEPAIPGIGFFRAAYYVPVITMMVVVALSWKLIFDTDFGMLNQLLLKLGIIKNGIPWLTDRRFALWTVMSVTLWKGLGYYMIMFLVGLKAVPRELIEAATIDGARTDQVFRHVKLPSVWPIVSLTAILSAISALQVFEEIYVMTSGRIGTSTMVYRIYTTGLSSSGGLEMGYASAMGLILFVILLVFSAVAIRFMEGAYRT